MTIRHHTGASLRTLHPDLKSLARAARYPNAGLDDISHAFVAYDKARPIAYAGLACYRGHWCLRVCVVHPSYRGRGIQRSLIRARIRYLRSKAAHHVNVWAAPSNTYSLNNLVTEGFRFVREKQRAFHGVDHVKLRKTL